MARVEGMAGRAETRTDRVMTEAPTTSRDGEVLDDALTQG
jgi:hypothetical protein